jgi:hypothetical protein
MVAVILLLKSKIVLFIQVKGNVKNVYQHTNYKKNRYNALKIKQGVLNLIEMECVCNVKME